MKKLVSLILCLCMTFVLSACSQDTSEEDAKAVADKYYTALSDGDWNKAQKYYTKDVDDGNDLDAIASAGDEIENQINDFGLTSEQEESVRNACQNFFKTAISEYVRSYEITNTSKNDDSTRVTVTVKIKGFKNSDFQSIDYNTLESGLEDKYADRIINASSQEDINQIMVDIIIDLFDEYDDAVKDLDTATHTEKVTLVKKGDGSNATWKIKKIKVTDSSDEEDDV